MQLDKFLCKFFLFLEEVTIYCFDFQQLHVSQFLGVVLLQFPDAVYQEQVVVLVCARLYINVSLTSSYDDYKKDTNSHIYYTLIVPIQSTLLVDDIFQHLKTRNNNKRSINTSGQRIRFLIQQESSKNSHKNARRQNIQQLLENNKKGNEQAKNTIRIVIYGDNEPQKCSKCQQKDNIQALMTGQDIRQGHEAIYQVRGQEVVDDLYNNQNQQWQIQDETDKLVIFLSIGQINLQTPEKKNCHQQHEKHSTDCIANLFNIIALLDISIKFLSGTIITFHNIIHLPDITISWCPCNVSLDLIFQQFEHDKYCIHYLNHFPQDVQVFSSDVEEYKVRQCMCIDFMQHFDRVGDIEIFYIIMEIVRILSNIKYHKGQYLNTPNQTYKIIIIKYIRQTTLMRQNNNFRYESSESDSSSDNYHEDSEHAEINVQYRVNSYRQQPEHNEDSYQRYEEEDEPHSHITYQHSSDIQGQNYMDEDQEDQGNSNFSWNSNSGFRGHIFQEQRRGMSEAQINKIPMLKWTQQYEKINKEEKCPICLNSYEIGQQLRLIFCMHRFHQKCIDRWLQSNRSCPTCRNAIQQISQK